MHGATIGRNQRGSTFVCTPDINTWIRDLQCGVLNSPQSKARRRRLAQLRGIGQTEVVKVLQAGRQLLELDNSRAALAGVVHESILHSQLLPTI